MIITFHPPVHPHVRGEHEVNPDLRNFAAGSPPRAWGAYAPGYFCFGFPRFTPTCVGSITWRTVSGWKWTVHPHVRGEHLRPGSLPGIVSGSPPRAWGAFSRLQRGILCRRFTPTCVGSMLQDQVGQYCRVGSPPRAWGA